jgi:CPA2 family monovalent cation:H+ antiporter-2
MPHRVLESLASTLHADLIVVGASERGRRWPLGLGSTADRVIRKSPCPVLVLRPGVPFPPRRVLVPVDFSPGSAGALRYGAGFLIETAGKLPPTEAVFVMSPGESTLHFSPEQIGRFAAAELHRLVERTVLRLAHAVDCRVRSGYPADQIVLEIEERHPDLVILGTREKSGLERLLLGSVASTVLREAPCNVLIIPPDAALSEARQAEAEALKSADWSYVSDETPEPVEVR